MASSRVPTAITWSAATSTTLNTNNVVASDAFNFHIEDWEATLVVSADNDGTTPAAGDTVDLWLSWTVGDVLGDSGDDFTTNEHSEFLARLDTVAANTPGEDPVRAAFHLPTAAKGFKLLARANQGATRSVTLRAMISTHRVQ